jgi:DnaK suppressor protein
MIVTRVSIPTPLVPPPGWLPGVRGLTVFPVGLPLLAAPREGAHISTQTLPGSPSIPPAGKERNVPESDTETAKVELHRRRRVILETTRRAAAELDALRSAERDPEFEEGAQTEHEAFTLARLGEAQLRELHQIDAALLRLEAGEYGLCTDCGQEIDPRRLKALPYALLCTECATGRERAQGAWVQEPPGTGI